MGLVDLDSDPHLEGFLHPDSESRISKKKREVNKKYLYY
jgi:hypothetical protein